MGFWNFLKKKELAKICELEQKIVELNSHIQKLHDYEVIVDAESEASRIMEEANQKCAKKLFYRLKMNILFWYRKIIP
jgi:hypothetical protein